VVDFIGVFGWPTFNLADAAIVVGTLILVWQVLRGSRA
jgi:lipoprotein signal peptidase